MASQRVLEKLGLRHVRSFRLTPDDILSADTHHVDSADVWDGDDLEFAVTRSEWFAHQARPLTSLSGTNMAANEDKRNYLEDATFAFDANKAGKVFIFWHGKRVKILKARPQKFLTKIDGLDAADAQLIWRKRPATSSAATSANSWRHALL